MGVHVVLVRGAAAHAEPAREAPPALVVGRRRGRRGRIASAAPSLAQLARTAQGVPELAGTPVEYNITFTTYLSGATVWS